MALKLSKNKIKTFKYITGDQREEKLPFTLTVKPLTPKEYATIEDNIIKVNKDESVSFTTGTFNWQICKRGILDWENFLNDKNIQIKPKKEFDEVSDASLNQLPYDYITEIANVIVGITKDPDNANLYLGNFDEENTKNKSS